MRTLIAVMVAAILAYLIASAFYGFVVGRDINRAKSNPFVAMGANLAGRDAAERVAIAQLQVPPFFTASPTFWMTLRLTE